MCNLCYISSSLQNFRFPKLQILLVFYLDVRRGRPSLSQPCSCHDAICIFSARGLLHRNRSSFGKLDFMVDYKKRGIFLTLNVCSWTLTFIKYFLQSCYLLIWIRHLKDTIKTSVMNWRLYFYCPSQHFLVRNVI